MRAQYVGQPIGGFAQPAVGDVFVASIGPRVQDGKTIGLILRPTVTDIDANILSGRHGPAKLTIERIVVLDAGQHRHGDKLVSRITRVSPAFRCLPFADAGRELSQT
jgi:hypothetical protein